tara:strand:+ start:89 stop:316 length:228 start_codon:yes stop_codon:yes gene_type:complete
MNNTIIIAIFVSLLYFLLKMLEARFIQKEEKQLKDLIKDTVIVAISSVVAVYSVEQFYTPSIERGTDAFIGKPEF